MRGEIEVQKECARMMYRAGVLPDAFKDNVHLAVLAMRTCANLRLPWEQNLKFFYNVGGALAVYGDLTRMLVERTGEVEGEERFFQYRDADSGEWVRLEEWEVEATFTWESAPDSLTAVCKVWRKGRREPYMGHFSVGTARARKDRRGVSLWEKQQYRASPGFVVKMGWNAEHMAKRRGFPDAYEGIQAKEELEDALLTGPSSMAKSPAAIEPARRRDASAASDAGEHGEREVEQEPRDEASAGETHEIECEACLGTGSVGKRADDCKTCGGSGKILAPLTEDELSNAEGSSQPTRQEDDDDDGTGKNLFE